MMILEKYTLDEKARQMVESDLPWLSSRLNWSVITD